VAPLQSWKAAAGLAPGRLALAAAVQEHAPPPVLVALRPGRPVLAAGRLVLAAAVQEHAPPPVLVALRPGRPVLAAELGERSVAALAAAQPQEPLRARAVSLAASRDFPSRPGHAAALRFG